MIKDAGPGVKSKASANGVERIARHPAGWDLMKELSQRKAEV
jgi:hypothetical protein